MTAPTVRHRDVGDKFATDVPKIKKNSGRENMECENSEASWETHAMCMYHWNILGLCAMRWKNFDEMSADDGHKVYFSGEEDRHEYGV